jgi:hypothetical protein
MIFNTEDNSTKLKPKEEMMKLRSLMKLLEYSELKSENYKNILTNSKLKAIIDWSKGIAF